MAKPNYQFEKRQKELAKKNKQEEKRRQKSAGTGGENDLTQSDSTNVSGVTMSGGNSDATTPAPATRPAAQD